MTESGSEPVSLTEGRAEMGLEIRPLRFGSAEIDAAVQRSLDALPADEESAVVATTSFDKTGADLSVAWKINGRWSAGGYLRKEKGGPVAGGARVVWTPKRGHR